MRECQVEMLGDDGQIHGALVEATSLFDAAEQALHHWARLSWFNPNLGVRVRSGPDTWTVSQKQLRAKRRNEAIKTKEPIRRPALTVNAPTTSL